MPSRNPNVISVRGTGEYQRFLRKLLKKVQKDHPDVTSVHRLTILSIKVIAQRYDMEAPPHAGPRGPLPKRPF